MVDITKCSTENCPLSIICYRKQAVANVYRQSYGNFPVVNGKCDFFIALKSEKSKSIDNTPL